MAKPLVGVLTPILRQQLRVSLRLLIVKVEWGPFMKPARFSTPTAAALKLFTSNDHYRIRGHYTPPAKGAETGGAWTQWTHFTVR
ncbi:hypothetical protein [Streptomyces sp. NBC_00358]|uniref:hypothetical protein n=1 Tax=Streptomyces sp. NBC_00358 TaxID=2975725 RepID=UPI002E26C70E